MAWEGPPRECFASGVGNFTATASKKTIAAGDTRVLVFEFQNNAVSDSTQYRGTLWFGGCYLGFPSAGSAVDVPATPLIAPGVRLLVAPTPFSGTSSISDRLPVLRERIASVRRG